MTTRQQAARGGGIEASVEQLALAASLFWVLSADRAFLGRVLAGQAAHDLGAWGLGAAMVVLLVALHALLVALLANRWTVKPLLAVLTVIAAAAGHFIGAYGVVLDPTMLRNVLRTDVHEARELLNPEFALHMVLYAGVPLLLLARVRVVQRPWARAALRRALFVLAAAAAAVAALLAAFQPLSSLMRNERELRYLITPANVLWSLSSVVAADARGAAAPRRPIGLDAAPGASWPARRKPLVLVLVVGETARAANWGLDGYARQTTPQLAALPGLVNFEHVGACGTNTEVSLPCLFAPVGRRDHDAERIRGQQSLLHVLARAGVGVSWQDNQSGCKGVCDGLPALTVSAREAPGLCSDGRCLDEALLHDLDDRLQHARGTQLWVLHMLGNHGPSYFRRHPPAFARYTPECQDDDLRRCTNEQIVNAYDNALLYTDHVLASAIAKLRAHAGEVDSALLYVSDHGESLGEHGLYLHGLPYAIAPAEQTRVPMVFWASDGFEHGSGLPAGCLQQELRRQAKAPLAHDHLFHTVLGLLDVRTALHEGSLDLVQPCRAAAAAS